jgi:nickel transport protein
MKVKQFFVVLLVLVSLLGFPSQAFAHGVETNYNLNIKSLELQSLFSTGEAFKDAPVIVHPPAGSDYAPIEGRTNEQGMFVFEPDYSVSGEWEVEIGEDSHWDMLVIPVSDRGIDVEAISQIQEDHPHHHHYLASQIIVVVVAIGCGIGSQFISHKFKN